jgi:hypothetical protein
MWLKGKETRKRIKRSRARIPVRLLKSYHNDKILPGQELLSGSPQIETLKAESKMERGWFGDDSPPPPKKMEQSE